VRISLPFFVYSQWVVIVGFAASLIGLALWKGYSRAKTLVFWRGVKLASALLGTVGIALLLVRIDSDTREQFSGEARNILLLEFIDAKAYLAEHTAELCATQTPPGEILHSQANTCWDLKNIDAQVSVINIRDIKQFRPIKNWQNNPAIADIITEINRRIQYMNGLFPRDEDRFSLLDDNARLWLLFGACVLLVLAVSGSVGEAAYQFVDARARAVPELDTRPVTPTPTAASDLTNPRDDPNHRGTPPKREL
jgi:hypothetical protein